MSCHQNLSVVLQSHSHAPVVVTANVRDYLTSTAKARVQTAVGVIAYQCKIAVTPVAGRTGDDDFPVALQAQTVADIVATGKVGYYLARAVKCRVESAIRVVPHNGTIGVVAVGRNSGDDNFPVTLNGYFPPGVS